MAAGSLQQIIVCTAKAPQVGRSVAPCSDLSGVFQQPVMVQAYVLDPGAQTLIDAALLPFDYTVYGPIWVMAFTLVVGLYLVLNLIRGR